MEVEVFFLKGKPDLFGEFTNIGASVRSDLVGKNFLIQVLIFARICKKDRFLTHAHLPKSELLCAFSCERKLFIFSRHNAEPFWPSAPKIISHIVSRFVAARSSKAIAISAAVREYLISSGELSRNYPIDIILYGFDTWQESIEDLELFSKKPSPVFQREFKIGTIARLVPQKDFPTLFDAFKKIRKQIPNAQLQIVGEGFLKEKLIDLSLELDIAESIQWIGKISNVHSFLQPFDIFVLASSYEGFGLVLLEAMFADVPILAANNSAIPEVLGKDYQGLFQTGNSQSLANKLINAHSNPEMTSNLIEELRVRKHLFSAKSMADKVFDSYKSALILSNRQI
jgi:glycosyltransferase involved in cell wall biosynthesis